MPFLLGAAAIGGGIALGGKLYGDYRSRKAQEEAQRKAQSSQEGLYGEQSANQQRAAEWANEQLRTGSQQGQDQLRQSMGAAQGYTQQGYNDAQGYLGQYYGQGQGYLGMGDQLAMQRLGAGQQAAQGTLERTAANSRLAALMGGGLAAGFEADPGYQFRQQQGEQALRRQAAASGGRIGTRSMQSLANFNSGLASQEYGNYANRAIGMAGTEDARQASLMGQLAGQQFGAGQMGAGYGQNYGNSMAQSAFGMGSNLSNLATGRGSALAGLEMAGGNNLAQMMFGTGQQLGANAMAGAGATVGLAGNMLQQYNNPVGSAGYDGWGNAAQGFGNLAGNMGVAVGQAYGGNDGMNYDRAAYYNLTDRPTPVGGGS